MRGQEVILLNFPISHFFKSFAHSALLTEGGGGVQEPLILADIICEQPLTRHNLELKGHTGLNSAVVGFAPGFSTPQTHQPHQPHN